MMNIKISIDSENYKKLTKGVRVFFVSQGLVFLYLIYLIAHLTLIESSTGDNNDGMQYLGTVLGFPLIWFVYLLIRGLSALFRNKPLKQLMKQQTKILLLSTGLSLLIMLIAETLH